MPHGAWERVITSMESFTKLVPNFLFILLRAGIVLTMLPYFSGRSFPPSFRIGMAVALSLVLAPVITFPVANGPTSLIVVREVMFGMIFGLAARFIFYAVDMAGHLMSTASGYSAAATFNPDMGPSTEISQLFNIIATLLFFATDAHHDLITVFIKSYEWLPAGTVNIGGIMEAGVYFATKIFSIALKLSAPIAIIMLITNILFGFIYKAAPQMNVYFVGQPVYIFVGLFTMLLSLPVFMHVMSGYFSSIKDEMGRVILLMKG